MEEVWKYVKQGTVNHFFEHKLAERPVCKCMAAWFSYQEWKADKEGLNSRRKCKSCIKIKARIEK